MSLPIDCQLRILNLQNDLKSILWLFFQMFGASEAEREEMLEEEVELEEDILEIEEELAEIKEQHWKENYIAECNIKRAWQYMNQIMQLCIVIWDRVISFWNTISILTLFELIHWVICVKVKKKFCVHLQKQGSIFCWSSSF